MSLVVFGVAYLPMDRTRYVESAVRVERALFGPHASMRLTWVRDGFLHEVVAVVGAAGPAWYAVRERANEWNALRSNAGVVAVPYVQVPDTVPACPQCRGRSEWSVGFDPSDPLNAVPDVCEDCDHEGGRPW